MSKIALLKKNRSCHQTGFGFDSHAFGLRGTLVLGGVRFPGVPALRGHSDGDALLHAVIDALLGASATGDIGELFPDTSSRWKGASSRVMLKRALQKVRRTGFEPRHIDITVVADRPRLTPAKARIRRAIARTVGMPPQHINVKAKTQEGLRWFGSEGGIAAWAVATLQKAREP